LFCGIYREPEFYDPSIFVKHRPTFKLEFYSTTGERDFEQLDEESKKEELAYQEFIVDQKVDTDNLYRLWYLPSILFQLTLTFFCFAIKQGIGIRPRNLIIHFLINLIPSTIIIALMLSNEGSWWVLGLGLLLLAINVCTARYKRIKPNIGSGHYLKS
jgi:hypothetical protein